MNRVAWIGLGVMGYPMAGFLSRNPDISLCAYNRTTAIAELWQNEYSSEIAEQPDRVASGAEFVFSCVGNDNDVRSVTIGENGAFNTMQPGGVFIDHSTTSATLAKELSEAAKERGLTFLDAPVTGGQKGAENGQLSIMVGGDEAALERARPLVECYAKAVKFMGPPGAGCQTKMVNQIAIAGIAQGLAEAINFAQKAGLNVEDVVSVISKGAAQSWQMDNSAVLMAKGEHDYGFAVDLMRKDLNICLDEAEKNGADLTITNLIETYFADLQQMGGGRWDITSLIARLKK